MSGVRGYPLAYASGVKLRPAITEAARTLAAAGVPSPQADAEILAGQVLGIPRTQLVLAPEITATALQEYQLLIARRAKRIPLQYLTGTAALGPIEVAVGPGVFVPRPETELILEWALTKLATTESPLVVDLCAGSGALGLAIAHSRPDARVHAVELDPQALAWARRNISSQAAQGDTPLMLHAGDVTDAGTLAELDGRADVVVANPPYVPLGARLEPEVAEHDPDVALFGGEDGLKVIRPLAASIARLLRPGGAAAVEHDDSNGVGTAAALAAAGLTGITQHRDLAGRPRFVSASAAS